MRILCGTDLLPKTESAIDRAGMLAVRLGAELSLLHVVEPTESRRMLKQSVERAKRDLESRATPPAWDRGPSPCVRVRSGNPARVLIATARALNADLVVLGTHRRRLMHDALAGTLAERLLSELKCPVLIVQRMPWYAYRNVLLALDCSKASASAVRAAEELVLPAGTRASVVHAYQAPCDDMLTSAGIAAGGVEAYAIDCRRRASADLQDLLRWATDDYSRYEILLEDATIVAAVRNVSARLHPDLLVMGTRGRGRWERALLGSVANGLLSSAKSDVLAVPPRELRGQWRRARADRLALDVVSGA